MPLRHYAVTATRLFVRDAFFALSVSFVFITSLTKVLFFYASAQDGLSLGANLPWIVHKNWRMIRRSASYQDFHVDDVDDPP